MKLINIFTTRILWVSFLLIVCFSCNNTKVAVPVEHYSKTQQQLYNLIDSYTSEFAKAKTERDKDSIHSKYHNLTESYLIDTLQRYIDSIIVVVDSVVQNGWLVTTHLHAGEIGFKYGMVFKDSMDSKNVSLYKFMRSLTPGKKLAVNLVHLGGGRLERPDNNQKRVMWVFAYPQPLSF